MENSSNEVAAFNWILLFNQMLIPPLISQTWFGYINTKNDGHLHIYLKFIL